MSEFNALDVELLSGYLANLNKAVIGQMLDLYRQQSAIYLADIKRAQAEQQQAEWQERCHKMKGAAGSVGLVRVHALLVELEKSTMAWADKALSLAQLTELNEQAISEFESWLAQ